VVVTVSGSDGAAPTTYYTNLAIGDTATIRVPEGATVVTLSRYARQRVRLAEREGSPDRVGRNQSSPRGKGNK
jgi:hypothetical protein